MTENEAIMVIENERPSCGEKIKLTEEEKCEAYNMTIQALEEVQQYRKIGTVDECREAVEKQTAKKPMPIDYEKYIDIIDNAKFLRGAFWCPNCRHVVYSGSFCKDCGQKLDWSDEE